jgi:hypothetical protein
MMHTVLLANTSISLALPNARLTKWPEWAAGQVLVLEPPLAPGHFQLLSGTFPVTL